MPPSRDQEPPALSNLLSRFSLSLKLSLTFALALLLGMLGMGLYANQRAREQAVRGELATLGLLSERLAGQVDVYLSTTRNLARHLAQTQDVSGFLRARPKGKGGEAFQRWLDQQVEASPHLATLFVMAPDGTCLASSNQAFIGRDFRFRPYFQGAMAGQVTSSDWFIGAVTRTPRVSTAAPVHSADRILGVLVTEYHVEELERIVKSFSQMGRTVTLINRLGIALTHSDPTLAYAAIAPIPQGELDDLARTRQFLGRSFPVSPVSAEGVAAFRATLQDGQPRTASYRLGGLPKWGALNAVQGLPWVALISAPESAILQPTQRIWRTTLAAGLLSVGGAFLVALVLLSLLLHPLQDLTSTLSAFGRGEGQVRATRQPHRELDHLARSFNTMADTIQSQHEGLEDLVRQRTRDLEQALADVKRLHGMIPICGYCKKIRDDEGSWWQLESYIQEHTEAAFSHGICPDCRVSHFPERSPRAKP